MVSAVNAFDGQSFVNVIGESAPAARVSLATPVVIYNYPSDYLYAGQDFINTVAESSPVANVSQAMVVVVYRGRIDNPIIRAWTFTLDGHDFYVLRLGTTYPTLVYDTYSEQWSVYGSGISDSWYVATGRNWQGGRKHALNWSDVVVGDDSTGALFFLSPDGDSDENSAGETTAFRRQVTGQVVVKPGYASAPCYGVQLYGSIGGDSGTVNLEVSDDLGSTYSDMGDVTLAGGEYTTRAHWRSLGSMVAPGRLFRVTDEGALKRIDGIVMDD